MDDQHLSTKVYMIGNKSHIQECLPRMLGRSVEIQNMWTVIPSESIPKNTESMEKLKEQEMDNGENNKDIEKQKSSLSEDRPSSSERLPEGVDRTDYATNDFICLSETRKDKQSTIKSEDDQVLADINAIVVEEETGINALLASFIFRLFAWPALVILAINSDSFDIGLYEVFVKELGVLASFVKTKSKLMVVDINTHITEEIYKRVDDLPPRSEFRFHSAIRNSYFSSGRFKWCGIHEMNFYLKSFLKETCTRSRHVQSTLKDMFPSGQLFYEVVDKKEMESFVIKRELILFTVDDTYACKPDELINKFRIILDKLLPLSKLLKVRLSQFSQAIGNTSVTDYFVEVLSATSFIQVSEENLQNPLLTLLPFINCLTTLDFDQKTCFAYGNALRLTIKLDVIPAFIKAKIYSIILSKGWEIMSLGPHNDHLTGSLIFYKNSNGFLIRFCSCYQNKSYVYLLALAIGTNCKEKEKTSEYQELRHTVEREIQEFKKEQIGEDNIAYQYVKVRDDQTMVNIIETKEAHWEKLTFEKNSVKRNVSPWYFTETQEEDKELNQTISDSMLANVSSLFGKSMSMFFVSEGIPYAVVSQVEKDNRGEVKEATFQMLCEWRKRKGPSVTVRDLRSAIVGSRHVYINMDDFDKIASENNEN